MALEAAIAPSRQVTITASTSAPWMMAGTGETCVEVDDAAEVWREPQERRRPARLLFMLFNVSRH